MTTNILFGNVPCERDDESGEGFDADGIGCFRGLIFSFIVLGVVIVAASLL